MTKPTAKKPRQTVKSLREDIVANVVVYGYQHGSCTEGMVEFIASSLGVDEEQASALVHDARFSEYEITIKAIMPTYTSEKLTTHRIEATLAAQLGVKHSLGEYVTVTQIVVADLTHGDTWTSDDPEPVGDDDWPRTDWDD